MPRSTLAWMWSGKRGWYHEVRMIMQTVNLYDRIRRWTGPKTADQDGDESPVRSGRGRETFAWRAAKLLLDEKGIKDGVTIKDPQIYSCCGRHGWRQYRCGSCFSRCEPDV